MISIVPIVNLPGIKPGEMVLNGDLLSKIFMGQISKWSDPAIAKLNPGVKLPDTTILTVHRSDGSGTTFNFTNYLGKVNPEWRSKIGADTSVEWLGGIGGKGNAGVAASGAAGSRLHRLCRICLRQAVGVGLDDLVNAAGKRVQPTMEAFEAAAANADFSKAQDFYLILTNQPAPKAGRLPRRPTCCCAPTTIRPRTRRSSNSWTMRCVTAPPTPQPGLCAAPAKSGEADRGVLGADPESDAVIWGLRAGPQ